MGHHSKKSTSGNNRDGGSAFVRVILPAWYNPPPKPPSKRDLHRLQVAEIKAMKK